ncbi:hypothetical protein BT69DRAFT_1280019, partial [Atractiella rhizophila]
MPPKPAGKRIAKEIADLDKNTPPNCRIWIKNESNLFEWAAELEGPEDSPYEEGLFKLDISLPQDYPFRAPRVVFKTRIYHPNINGQGGICLDILKTKWSPALSILSVVLSISALLCDPNPADPLVAEIAQVYNRNREQFNKTAREWTKNYALKPKLKIKEKSEVVNLEEDDEKRKGKGKGKVQEVVDLTEEGGSPERSRRGARSGETEVIQLD